MQDLIEKLLILQDRDAKISRLEQLLSRIAPERQSLIENASRSAANQEAAKTQWNKLESERKRLELEVEDRKQRIEKYSLQQYQTKKNDEYRALAHEIETCKTEITRLEDQELELMEKAEAAQREAQAASKESLELKKLAEQQIAELDQRESLVEKELAELDIGREPLAEAVEPRTRKLYERLLQSKGEKVVVGVEHGNCGGCHMKLQMQLVVSCKGQKELVTCLNCGRILYYTVHMDMAERE